MCIGRYMVHIGVIYVLLVLCVCGMYYLLPIPVYFLFIVLYTILFFIYLLITYIFYAFFAPCYMRNFLFMFTTYTGTYLRHLFANNYLFICFYLLCIFRLVFKFNVIRGTLCYLFI